MGLATHLGPWLLGTVKNTTGTTVGNIRNVGAGTVIQQAVFDVSKITVPATTVAAAAVQLFVIPAGSYIFNFLLDTTVAYNGTGTPSDSIVITTSNGGTSLMTASVGSVGRATATPTGAAIAKYVNVSVGQVTPVDVIISAVYTPTYSTLAPTAGTTSITCLYAVRQADGTYIPTSVTA